MPLLGSKMCCTERYEAAVQINIFRTVLQSLWGARNIWCLTTAPLWFSFFVFYHQNVVASWSTVLIYLLNDEHIACTCWGIYRPNIPDFFFITDRVMISFCVFVSAQSFKEFSQLLNTVEEERRRLVRKTFLCIWLVFLFGTWYTTTKQTLITKAHIACYLVFSNPFARTL